MAKTPGFDSLLLLFVSGALNGVGQVVMRWGGRSTQVPFTFGNVGAWVLDSKLWLAGLCITWLSGLFWAVLLRKVTLAVALPIFAGTAYALTILGSAAFLNERPTNVQWAGLGLILTGILLIGSQR